MSGRVTDEKQDRLIGVFEMLVERLTSLESKVDRVEAILERENVGREGRLNTRAWDLDTNIFVHKPLSKGGCDFFSPPAMYYVKTCFDMDHLFRCDTYTIIQKKLVAGEFDARLANCDSAGIKENARLMLDGNDEADWTECEQVSLESQRRYVYDHFLDVMISDWAASNRSQWKFIRCMTGIRCWPLDGAIRRNERGLRRSKVYGCAGRYPRGNRGPTWTQESADMCTELVPGYLPQRLRRGAGSVLRKRRPQERTMETGNWRV